MRKVVVPMRLRELYVARLPGVVELEVRFDVLGELQTLQRADRELSWEANLGFIVDHLA